VLKKYVELVCADASGDADVYTAPMTGKLLAIRMIPHGTAPCANTLDVVIAHYLDASVYVYLWAEDNLAATAAWIRPRFDATDNDNSTSRSTAETNVCEPYELADDRLRIILAQAGASKKALFEFIVEE